MRADEFSESLRLLPSDLAAELRPLRWFATRASACPACAAVRDAVRFAVAAAGYDDAAARQQVSRAHCLAASQVCEAASAADCPGRLYRFPPGGLHGRVDWWPSPLGRLEAATDASWRDGMAGLGYVVSDGRWGVRARRTDRVDRTTGPSTTLVSELRAVTFLFTGLDLDTETEMIVLIDSSRALGYLNRWKAGQTSYMPDGYSLRPRSGARQPSLLWLAERVADLPSVSYQRVQGHSGHPLNEAADALAGMARRHVREPFDIAARARGLVEQFLRGGIPHVQGNRF
jgi:ribonuclease HI